MNIGHCAVSAHLRASQEENLRAVLGPPFGWAVFQGHGWDIPAPPEDISSFMAVGGWTRQQQHLNGAAHKYNSQPPLAYTEWK